MTDAEILDFIERECADKCGCDPWWTVRGERIGWDAPRKKWGKTVKPETLRQAVERMSRELNAK